MKVCVFEWVSGGGCLFDRISVTSTDKGFISMLGQGQQMLAAITEDFFRAGHEVSWLKDSRLTLNDSPFGSEFVVEHAETLGQTLSDAARNCDAIMLIAPETGGCLQLVYEWLAEFSDRLISPDRDFIRLTSNKQQTCQWLANRNVPVPKGCLISEFDEFTQSTPLPPPWVVKPVDGAGSEGVQIIDCEMTLESMESRNLRVEEYVEGTSASVSVLCHGGTFELLPPTQQIFDSAPLGHYLKAVPLRSPLAERASELAIRTMLALPPTRGYIGIDIVLSRGLDTNDVVIEINPRLTMSYVWLRGLCEFNIAEKMMTGFIAGAVR